MRELTRVYTSALPRINLQFLANLHRKLTDSSQETPVYCDTESGRLYLSRESDGYSATINGVTRIIGVDTTLAGYGLRQWYVCPHCGARVAKLFIGSKDIGCRKCWNLHYASQSEDEADRLLRSLRKQRYAIWGDDWPLANSLLNSPLRFPKPTGMRWEIFDKKRARLLKTEAAYWRVKEPKLAKGFARVMRKTESAMRSMERSKKKNHT